MLPKTKPQIGGNEARISTAVGAPTGTAVPVRLYQAAVRASSAEAAASYSVQTRDAGSGGNGVKEGLHPAMPIPLRLLLIEDCDAERIHSLARCLKCCFESRVNSGSSGGH